jgi:WD40 repeat protein
VLGLTSAYLALTPDGKLLVTPGEKGAAAQLWTLPDGGLSQTLKAPTDEAITRVAVSADSCTLVTGSASSVHVWSLPGGELRQTLEGQPGGLLCLGHGVGGRLIVASAAGGSSGDGTVALRCLPDGPLRRLTGHTGAVTCLAVSRDDSVLASGSRDGTVRLWGLPDGRPLKTLEHGPDVPCLAISPDGRLLASGSKDRTVRLWGLDLLRPASVPVGRAPPEMIARLEESLGNGQLAAAERALMEFTVALMRWRRRHDITLDAGPRRLEFGDFDIVIEG